MMMKKLLIFVLVLGLASTANAVLELSLNGDTDGPDNITEITIAPSDEITIDVYSPDGAPDKFWLGIAKLGGDGEWLGHNLYIPPAPSTMVITDGGYGPDWFYGNMPTPATDSEPGVWFDAVFHCLGEGTVSIDLYDAGGINVIDAILVTQLPEPATVLLLGLGGLFLRRRK
jgi:hypothetical protein